MLKVAESDIQKEHQVLMVNKTTSFKKNGKGKKGDSKKSGKAVAPPVKKPKAGPKPETECFHCKGTGHWKRNCPMYLVDKKAANTKQGIYDIMLLMCTLPTLVVVPGYLIPVRLLTFATQSRNYGIDGGWQRTN